MLVSSLFSAVYAIPALKGRATLGCRYAAPPSLRDVMMVAGEFTPRRELIPNPQPLIPNPRPHLLGAAKTEKAGVGAWDVPTAGGRAPE